MVHGICFLTKFLIGAEIRLILSIFIKPTTITRVLHGIWAPMLLAQVAMLLKANFLGSPDHRISTRMLLPFLALVESLLGRFQFGLLKGADALNRLQQR